LREFKISDVGVDMYCRMSTRLMAAGIEAEIKDLPRGCIVATADLVGCWKMFDGKAAGLCDSICIDLPDHWWKPISGNELFFGDWRPGRYAWEIANVKMLPVPIPCKGHQGLWNWEREVA
jgi:hypothetical protein